MHNNTTYAIMINNKQAQNIYKDICHITVLLEKNRRILSPKRKSENCYENTASVIIFASLYDSVDMSADDGIGGGDEYLGRG